MADVQLPDGNVARVPDFALEKTQEDMKRLLKALVGADDKAYKVFSKLVEQAKEQTEVTEDIAKEAKQLQKEQLKATQEVADAASKGKILGDKLFSGALKADAFLTTSFMQLGTAALSIAGTLFQGITEVGNELLELQKAGVGFTDATGSAEKLIADLSYLGMTAGSAADLMRNFSGVVQVMGKTGFSDIQRTFNQLSDNGNRFGLSIAESAAILGEDLELRKTLGMLETIDKQKQAQRSAALYEQQLQAAQALGKSVDEIRKGNQKLLEENFNFQISRARTVARLGEEAGAAYLASVESLSTEFQGMGLGQGAQDAILTAMSEPAAFLAQGGTELYTALSAMGAGGREISNEMQAIGKLMNGNADEQKQGMERMKAFAPMLQNNLAELLGDEKALGMFQNLVNTGSPAAGMMKDLFESAGLAKSALAGAANAAGSFQSGLAKASQAYNAAMDSIAGTMSGAMTDLSAAFAGPASAFADALSNSGPAFNELGQIVNKNGEAFAYTEEQIKDLGLTNVKAGDAIKNVTHLTEEQAKEAGKGQSVMSAFKDAVQVVRNTIDEAFGAVGDDGKDLAQRIREYVIPAIKDFSDWFAGDGLIKIQEVWSGVSGFFSGLGDVIGVVTDALGSLASFVNGIFGGGREEEYDEQGNLVKKQAADYSGLGKTIAYTVAGLFAFTKAIKLAQSAMALGGAAKSGIGGLLGRGASVAGNANMGGAGAAAGGLGKTIGTLGTGIKTALTGLAEGISKGVSSLAKGISTAFTSIMSGLAKGFTAFANPKILLGAGILAGAITVISAGIAAATALIGMALPTFAQGMKEFEGLDGEKLTNVATGIGAIGAAMAAMGAGGAVGAVGGAVSGIVEGISSFFGADTPLDKLKEFAEYDIDVAGVVYNAKAFTSFGEAMTSFGAGVSVSGIGSMIDGLASFMGADPVSMINKFADAQINVAGIDANIAALDRLDVMFAKYAALKLPDNIDEINDAVNKSAVKPEQPQNAYQTKVAGINRRESLMQPGVMSVDKQGNPVETPQVDTQAIINEGQNALINEFNKDASAPGATVTSSNIDALGQVMAQVAQNTRDTNRLLKRLDSSVQDTF